MSLNNLEKLVFLISVLFMKNINSQATLGSNEMTIVENGYSNVLVAISDNVAEDTTLLDRLRAVFTEASATLYEATRHRAYFKGIKILVPDSWRADATYSPPSMSQNFDSANIRVDSAQFGRVGPFVFRTAPCGEPGNYLHMTPEYLQNKTLAEQFGSYGRVLVHEWSHLRYGVFDEYPLTGDPNFYSTQDGRIIATRCSLAISGVQLDSSTGGRCRLGANNLPVDTCRFQDSKPSKAGYGSLMYRNYIDNIDSFCDEDSRTTDGRRLHNAEAPTQQNRFCGRRSVWSVITSNADFSNDNNLPATLQDTTPQFTALRRPPAVPATVLVLDTSGSMNSDHRLDRLLEGCYYYISNKVCDGSRLGIVEFNNAAAILARVTTVDSVTRQTLLNALPQDADGGTSIASGILEAIDMLLDEELSTIIVVSDGEETSDPKIADKLSQIAAANVTLHAIAVTDSADNAMDAVAALKGGLSFIYPNNNRSNALTQAFDAIGNLDTEFCSPSLTILSTVETLTDASPTTGSVMIDSSLGNNTRFTFDFIEGNLVGTITSPNGTVYNTNDTATLFNSDVGVYTIPIPLSDATPGNWTYDLRPVGTEQVITSILVTSEHRNYAPLPVTVNPYWFRREIASISPDQENEQQILFAAVSQGYAPVLNANIRARIETPGGEIHDLILKDNGQGADMTGNDGVYSGYFIFFDAAGRYGVEVLATSSDGTVVSPSRYIGRGVAENVFLNNVQPADIPVDYVQRAQIGLNFLLQRIDNPNGLALYPPGRITDLTVTEVVLENRTITLQWTAVGSQLNVGTASSYELRYSTTDVQDQLVNANIVIEGAETLQSPQPAGQTEQLTLQMHGDAVGYQFVIAAVDNTNGSNVIGEPSNIATATLRDHTEKTTEDEENGLSGFALGAIILGVGLAFSISIIVLILIGTEACTKKPHKDKSRFLDSPQRKSHSSGRSRYRPRNVYNTYLP